MWKDRAQSITFGELKAVHLILMIKMRRALRSMERGYLFLQLDDQAFVHILNSIVS